MNNEEIIEEVLNNPKNHGTGTINLIEKALAMKDAEHLKFLKSIDPYVMNMDEVLEIVSKEILRIESEGKEK